LDRNRNDPQLSALSKFYRERFFEARHFFVDQCRCNLITAFRKLRDAGVLEIIACAATHALLPLFQQQSPAAARAQVLIGRDIYLETFGGAPAGFWLPECAYAPALTPILQAANLRWFVVDSHGLLFGQP